MERTRKFQNIQSWDLEYPFWICFDFCYSIYPGFRKEFDQKRPEIRLKWAIFAKHIIKIWYKRLTRFLKSLKHIRELSLRTALTSSSRSVLDRQKFLKSPRILESALKSNRPLKTRYKRFTKKCKNFKLMLISTLFRRQEDLSKILERLIMCLMMEKLS
jgi:hypothetical protein